MAEIKEKKRIGVLVSGSGSNLQAIIDACDKDDIKGEIVFVGADNPDAYGLVRAKEHNPPIPTFVVDYKQIKESGEYELPDDFNMGSLLRSQRIFKDPSADTMSTLCFKVAAEVVLLQKMSEYKIDLLVLAGFMQLFTPYFIRKMSPDPLNPTIMNIHPAYLPAFKGTDGYGDAYRYGSKIVVITVHFVDEGEDTGPVIGQRSFDVEEDDTIDTIKKKGLPIEWKLFPECIEKFIQGRLKVEERVSDLGKRGIYRRKVVKILD